MNMYAKWYVVANRTEAVIYQDGTDNQFHFIERMTNDKGRRTETQLDSDRPGRGASSFRGGAVRHSLDRHFDRHEQVAKRFAARIGKMLEVAKMQQRFQKLVLVAEPHFLGLLLAKLPAGVKTSVTDTLGREYARGSDTEIREKIISAINEFAESA